ncbi:unnamed protein product [Ilex paraguariensis]|uniref:F-box associated beta-propeller type 1 domain-containing protein n=1 Tax=Ilex paraguariensis TaxID=185542 RepID=A0ABC8SN70_9AQUA
MQCQYSNAYEPKLLGVRTDSEDLTPDIYLYSFNHMPQNLPLPFSYSFEHPASVQGSCNGLVCVTLNEGSTIVLWNPATRQFRPIRVPFVNAWFSDMSTTFGFGFLPDENDYKVVRIPLRKSNSTPVSVYSLGSDSWRAIRVAVPDMTFRLGAVSVNGFLHWLAYQLKEIELIVSFDLRNEVFQQMAMPDSCGFDYEIKREIVVLKGSLSVIVYSAPLTAGNSFEIWVMTEYGLQESWTKKFTIGTFSTTVWPVGVWSTEYLIM